MARSYSEWKKWKDSLPLDKPLCSRLLTTTSDLWQKFPFPVRTAPNKIAADCLGFSSTRSPRWMTLQIAAREVGGGRCVEGTVSYRAHNPHSPFRRAYQKKTAAVTEKRVETLPPDNVCFSFRPPPLPVRWCRKSTAAECHCSFGSWFGQLQTIMYICIDVLIFLYLWSQSRCDGQAM
jgi:hypothetical protein